MADRQLTLVLNWEKEKEDKFAQDFRIAQQHLQMHRQKLQGLEQYRLDYLRQIQGRAAQGLGAKHYNQHQAFIGKLDKACEQQAQVISKAKMVADQRKGLWLKQQQKRKAVEMLLENKRTQRQLVLDKAEQQQLDEIALQRFIRRTA